IWVSVPSKGSFALNPVVAIPHYDCSKNTVCGAKTNFSIYLHIISSPLNPGMLFLFITSFFSIFLLAALSREFSDETK
ncbi:MAG: hypothetical protein WC147_11375, partial [Syntrophomonas sp.]